MTAHPAGSNVLLFTRPARVADAAPFAAAMRAEDRAEFAIFGDPAAVLEEDIRQATWARVAVDAGGYVACWGLHQQTLLGGQGYAFCCTTDRVLQHRRAFAVASRAWVAAMLTECVTVTGWCAASYALSLRWLAWLGAELAPLPGTAFVEFTFRRKD